MRFCLIIKYEMNKITERLSHRFCLRAFCTEANFVMVIMFLLEFVQEEGV